MCFAVDAAMTLANLSIDKAKKLSDRRYLTDFVKLQKELFFAQCFALRNYGYPLFHENITAHYCGPCVDGLQSLVRWCGISQIEKPFPREMIAELSPMRRDALSWVVDTLGSYSMSELISAAKKTSAYQSVASQITDTYKPVISTEGMTNCLDKLLLEWGPFYDRVMSPRYA